MIHTLKPPPMTITQLINHLNNIEDKEKEILFTDIATNYKYKIFTIDKKNGDIIIEDTEEWKIIDFFSCKVPSLLA